MILNSDDHISLDQQNRRGQRFLQEILNNKNEQIEETKWTLLVIMNLEWREKINLVRNYYEADMKDN